MVELKFDYLNNDHQPQQTKFEYSLLQDEDAHLYLLDLSLLDIPTQACITGFGFYPDNNNLSGNALWFQLIEAGFIQPVTAR